MFGNKRGFGMYFNRITVFLCIIIMGFAIVLSADAAIVKVTAGKIKPLGDTTLVETVDLGATVIVAFAGKDYVSDILLDLGRPKDVDTIQIQNRDDTGTLYTIKDLAIFCSEDEDSPDFDPSDTDSFSMKVYDGKLEPVVAEKGVLRTADITNVKRRYFLIRIESSMWGFFEEIEQRSVVFIDVLTSSDK